MWHLRTKLGVFWLVETNSSDAGPQNQKYFLGVDDHELGVYDNASKAAKDVHDQETGFFRWDCQSTVKIPEDISNWSKGEPEEWH